jgi:hypothetical protein
MGALLNWYAQERLDLFLRIFLDKLSELDPALKTIDKAAVQRYLNDPKWKQIRDESERRVKVDLPAIIFNVQDPTVVRKCLQYVVTDLYVEDLSSHMKKDPLLMNFQNGVGYIPTGKLMKPHPSHLCSLMAGGEYHRKPIGTLSRFKEFLLDVANGDEEVVGWKILYLGYCLSGYTDEELIVFWWGEGGNGKGALVSISCSGVSLVSSSASSVEGTSEDARCPKRGPEASSYSNHRPSHRQRRFGLKKWIAMLPPPCCVISRRFETLEYFRAAFRAPISAPPHFGEARTTAVRGEVCGVESRAGTRGRAGGPAVPSGRGRAAAGGRGD